MFSGSVLRTIVIETTSEVGKCLFAGIRVFFAAFHTKRFFCGKSAECCGFVIRISPHVKGLLHLLHFPTKSVAGRKSNPLSFFPMFTGNNIMRAARRKRRRERKFGMHYASLVNPPPPFPTATPRDSHGFMQLCCREIKASMSLVVQNQTMGNSHSSVRYAYTVGKSLITHVLRVF